MAGAVWTGHVSLAFLWKSPIPPKIQVLERSGSGCNPESSLTKERLARLIGSHPFGSEELHAFQINNEAGEVLFVSTTLAPELQKWVMAALGRARVSSAALVVLDPASGDVLTMASYTADQKPVNLTLSSSFPAASLFKIVTAAAAVETANLTSGSTLAYDGRKHTLYRKQLMRDVQSGRHQVTLKDSFAKSINVVFGKLGAFTLGPKALEEFAQRFYFNQPIRFEMPVETSRFSPPDKDYFHLAEIASGFNRTTMLSPLHGALLAAAVANDGLIMEPTVVAEVFDQNNNIYYRHQPVSMGQVISAKTVIELKKMMRATITKGTGRPFFRDVRVHPVLSKLEIGGKSGSINNSQGRKVDWFVSFALKEGSEKIALAAVVVHNRDKLGVRAQSLVRDSIIHYFSPLVRSK
ncbi:MAG: hypothetical protein JRG97_11150 [Deltaproteobacteria bacterium]|nr:hypothetical protein [Deltaproteobacteria bacterium]MBW2052877.1 hypothetical protein [Deltaproteobacteria bacterium]MBW2141609.1 hypothetical protein [Deltaproteobacteria bacterium]MBW2322819.1 hypothetical protein [Deltaproteobacteria bacterium]